MRNDDGDNIVSMVSEFKAFIDRGNVLDLAVGVIIGAAFGKIVAALTDDFITPILSLATGGIDFSNMFLAIAPVPAGTAATLDGMKAAGVPVFAYGHFITELINFLILAWIIFLIVRTANRVLRPPIIDATPADVVLLTQIRDELRQRAQPLL